MEVDRRAELEVNKFGRLSLKELDRYRIKNYNPFNLPSYWSKRYMTLVRHLDLKRRQYYRVWSIPKEARKDVEVMELINLYQIVKELTDEKLRKPFNKRTDPNSCRGSKRSKEFKPQRSIKTFAGQV